MSEFRAKEYIKSEEGEIVYRIPLQNDLWIWVYSTVTPKTGVSRNRGEDAIRTVLMYHNWKAVMKVSKTLRTENWKENLREKIKELSERVTDQICPDGHPLVRRTARTGGHFLGCSMFPDCDYIQRKSAKPKPN
ncbi:MAG: topoisomerase DNA-binding C4 zinc finger domain-containing protein [Candidatus Thorarchaeota archaeon]|nr:topoisomerase DNA-binding C4 zinc finger domain-containing protein [Candidatus Thorarchaeota archaeon]